MKNTFKTINRMVVSFFAAWTFFLSHSCTTNKKDALPEANIEKEVNVVPQQSKVTNEILGQEKAWAEALVAGDMKTVSAIMHRDFRLKRVYGDAPPITKEMYLGMPGMSASSAEVTSFKIAEEMGPIVTARVTMTLDWQQEGVGKLPPHFDIIDTWQKREDGTWQILSRVSQIADKPFTEKKNAD
ncbi:MAG: nuclear transport factor 2 family protein [Bacteroidota bacterium]